MFRASSFIISACLFWQLLGCAANHKVYYSKLSALHTEVVDDGKTIAPMTNRVPDRPYIILGVVSMVYDYDEEHYRFHSADDSIKAMKILGREAYLRGADAVAFKNAVYFSMKKPRSESWSDVLKVLQTNITASAIKWASENENSAEVLPAGTDSQPIADSLLQSEKID